MPAGAHSVKKPSQHSLIIITTFAYIFSVSGGSAAALKTINNMTIRIPDGNAFRIRLTARNLISGEYTEAADLSNIDNLVINYVRRGIRFPHAYTIDEEGRATVADAGTLDCGFYGIELTGYYGGEKFRFYGKDLFEITTDTTNVIDPSNLIDIEITVKLNASGVSKDYVDHAINGMETSMETMQADLRDEIAEAGKVDDVKVNGVSVVSGKKANITVPTKVSDLDNDSGYQNEQQVQQKVDAAKITSADISVDGGTGTPSGSAGVSGNKLVIALHNIKGQKGDPGESIVGPTGPQGATSVYDQTTQDFLTTLETTTGQSQTKTMTQKAITDELMYADEEIDLSKYSVINNVYINAENNWWRTDGTGRNNGCLIIPIEPGTRIKAIGLYREGTTRATPQVVFLTSNTYSNKAPVQYAGDEQTYPSWSNGDEGEVKVAPYNAAYMYVRTKTSGSSVLPTLYVVKSMKEKMTEQNDDIQNNINSLSSIEDAVSSRTLLSERVYYEGYMKRNYYIAAGTGLWAYSTNNPCCFLPVIPGMKLKLDATEAVTPAYVAFLTSNVIEGEGETPHYVSGTLLINIAKGQTKYVEVPETAVYMYIRLKTSNVAIDLKVWKVTESQDCVVTEEKLNQAITDSQVYNLTSINTGNWSPINKYIDSNEWKTGSDGVNSCKLIPCNPGQILKLVRRNELSYHAFFLQDNDNTVGETPNYAGGVETMPWWDTEDKYVVVPNDAHYLYIRVRSSSTQVTPLPYEVTLIKDKIEDVGGDGFLVEQVKFLGSGNTPTLGLVHYSDIHGDSDAVRLLTSVLDKYSTYIDDSLVTGDVVQWYAEGTDDSQYPQGYDWWQASGLAERSLFVLGNHDGATIASSEYDDKDGTAAWDGKGQQWDYDTYFADYISGLGVTMPTGYDDPTSPYYKACFWHKDYTSAKVRLIGLDAIHRFDGTLDPNNNWAKLTNGIKHDSTEQEEWLIAKLAEAKALGYSVVLCGHYALDDYDNGNVGGRVVSQRTNDVVNWHYRNDIALTSDAKYNYRNRVTSSADRGWSKGTVNNIANIIQAFKNDGGKFVAYLHGHNHYEMFYYPKNYPDLLCIAAPQTGYMRGGATVSKPFLDMTRLSANFICFDTEYGLIKMMRFGSKTNRFLQPMNCICYDYQNKIVINEW